MRELHHRDEFGAQFDTFAHTAFRLETRDRYNETYTPNALRQFLNGEPIDYSPFTGWNDAVRERAASGKRMARVRVVSEPLSDYVRYAMHLAQFNVDAGEDIRYLPRQHAGELGLPDIDYWLFDSRAAAVLRYDDDDRSLDEFERIDDAEFIVQCNYWRDAAWHHAVTREEFAVKHGVI